MNASCPTGYWFDGIVEGRIGSADPAAIHALVHQLTDEGPIRFTLDREGGEFTLLPDGVVQPAERLVEARRDQLRIHLEQLLLLVGPECEIDSTLRCTELRADGTVVETAFAVIEGRLRSASRERPASAEHLERLRQGRGEIPRVPLPQRAGLIVVIAVLGLGLLGLIAWQQGFIHAGLRPGIATVTIDRGLAGELLLIRAEDRFGGWRVTISPGPAYPASADALRDLEQSAHDLAHRAMIQAIGSGGALWLRVEDPEGRVLRRQAVSLRPLLSGTPVETSVGGHMAAARIVLALDPGTP